VAIGNSEQLLCAVLRHENAEWTGSDDPAAFAEFLDAGRFHGVIPLLDAAFRSVPDLAAWPVELRSQCHSAALAHAGYELAHGAEIERVLSELAHADVPPQLLKGTGLAYGIYPSPVLRPRADTDLLIARDVRDRAIRTLQTLGYLRVGGPAGEFVGYQMQFQRRDSHGLVHNLDLHWRISDAQSFAWLISHTELTQAATAVPALGRFALRLGNVHALLLSLLHRAGTNLFQSPGLGDRLIWLYDTRLLVQAMTEDELDAFRNVVETARVGAIALEGLGHCDERFPAPRLTALIGALGSNPQARAGAELLSAGRLRREWLELLAIPPVVPRLAYLAERAFPSGEYMRERYAEASARSLAFLHSRRWLEGLGKLVQSSRR